MTTHQADPLESWFGTSPGGVGLPFGAVTLVYGITSPLVGATYAFGLPLALTITAVAVLAYLPGRPAVSRRRSR